MRPGNGDLDSLIVESLQKRTQLFCRREIDRGNRPRIDDDLLHRVLLTPNEPLQPFDEIADVSPELGKAMESVNTSGEGIRAAMNTLFLCTFNSNRWLWRMICPILSCISIMGNGTRGLVGQYEALRRHDTLDRLHMIKAPTLVINGTADRVVPPGCSEVIASRIPNARLVQVDNGSHAFFLEMKSRFNQEVMDFLRS